MLTEKELNEIISNWESVSDINDSDDGVLSSSSEREPEHEFDADNNMTQIQEENGVDRIVTFCQSVDDMLDGGFPLQSLTELCGAPGSGKTQLCLQLCVAVQIPRTCGGLEGQALYIDTRNGFTAGRLRDMAASCVSHCHLQGVKEFTVDKVMAGVHYILVHDVIELMAALHLVHSFIIKNDKVKLVVVDSLTFPFLHNSSNSLSKTRLLSLAVEKLHVIASQHNVSVVLTNQLSTRVCPGMESNLIPSQGESYGQSMNQRLIVGCYHSNRHAAVLFKSVNTPYTSAMFQITKNGIRDSS